MPEDNPTPPRYGQAAIAALSADYDKKLDVLRADLAQAKGSCATLSIELKDANESRAYVLAQCFPSIDASAASWETFALLVQEEIGGLRAMAPGDVPADEPRAQASAEPAARRPYTPPTVKRIAAPAQAVKRVPLKYNLEGPSSRMQFTPPPDGPRLTVVSVMPAPGLVTWEAEGRSEPGYLGQPTPEWCKWWGFFYTVPQVTALVTCKLSEPVDTSDVVHMPAQRNFPQRQAPQQRVAVESQELIPSMPAEPSPIVPSQVVDGDQLMAQLEGVELPPASDTERPAGMSEEPKTDPGTPRALDGSPEAPGPMFKAPKLVDDEEIAAELDAALDSLDPEPKGGGG